MEMIMAMLKALGDDVEFSVVDDVIDVVIQDFGGFDDDYDEISRDYDEDAVDGLLEMLESHCVSCMRDFYQVYEFDGFSVQIGYASYDI